MTLSDDKWNEIKSSRTFLPQLWLIMITVLLTITCGCSSSGTLRKDFVVESKIVDGRMVDKTDYLFVNDRRVMGTWQSVDFVAEIERFDPEKKLSQGSLHLKEIQFFEDGTTAGPWTWTNGLVIHPHDKTAAKYHIKKINGDMYMFFEWKSGDYSFGHWKPKYYVLKKV